jgi:hypothetical protein
MVEQPARQRKDSMGEVSQMAVNRKVVVPETRKQFIGRLHRAVASGQWTSGRRVLPCDRTWQQGHKYRQIRVVSFFYL